ncbi:MAG: hypothetical protein AB1758_09265 [Candidatus Eremiobacterota bacterium]
MRRNGGDHGLNTGKDSVKGYAAGLRKAIKDGHVENAYAFIGGGGAYVCSAKDTHELAAKVRYNPLFSSCSVEVVPIADAVDFLDHAPRHVERAKAKAKGGGGGSKPSGKPSGKPAAKPAAKPAPKPAAKAAAKPAPKAGKPSKPAGKKK